MKSGYGAAAGLWVGAVSTRWIWSPYTGWGDFIGYTVWMGLIDLLLVSRIFRWAKENL